MRTVYRNGVVHARPAAGAPPTALVVEDGRIAWIGADAELPDGPADEVVDLAGALVAPGFVDAHAHVLETGLAAVGIDLSTARSLEGALDLVAAAVAGDPSGPVLAFGWDETAWPERRPPTPAEVDRAAGGAEAYLARADLHSAVVSAALATRAGVRDLPGWAGGVVTGPAHERVRESLREADPARRAALVRAALALMARQGVVSVHEHSVPALDTRAGLAALLAATRDPSSGLPEVVGYRAELCETATDARRLADEIPGLAGVGGDLNVDGSLGSRSAALRAPYADDPAAGSGQLQLAAEQVANHVGAATRAGLQAAFHVIGDAAMHEVLLGCQAAAEVEGVDAVRAAGHRIEHGEMVDAPALARIVLLGLTISAQPAFDAAWGGPQGMYAQRLGPVRAANLNPLADLVASGVRLAFGSDSPVTPVDPWGGVRAAVLHHEPGQRLPVGTAFRAHTVGGHQAARRTGGELHVGAPATFAVWRADLLEDRETASSTAGPAAPQGPLPAAASHGDAVAPTCLRTVRDGVLLYETS